MSDTIKFCLVSKHYNKKYLNYCYNYFMASSCFILQIIKQDKYIYDYPNKENDKLIQKMFPEYRFRVLAKETIFYNNYLELKTLYGVNKKITKMVNKYFCNQCV